MKSFKIQFFATLFAILLVFATFCFVYGLINYFTHNYITGILFNSIGGIAVVFIVLALIISLFNKKE